MDLLKNVIYAGIGLASIAAEKIDVLVRELVQKGKLSDEEGKKIINDFFAHTDEHKNEFESKLKNAFDGFISKFDFVKRKEYDELLKRLHDLEEELERTKHQHN